MLEGKGIMRLPRNFPGVLLGLLLVAVFIGRSVPHALLRDYSFGVIGPIIGLLVVVAFVIALTLDRSSRNKPPRSPGRHGGSHHR